MLKMKIRWYKTLELHKNLVKQGSFTMAHMLFTLLNTGKLILWLDDDSHALEAMLFRLGHNIEYSRTGTKAIVRI